MNKSCRILLAGAVGIALVPFASSTYAAKCPTGDLLQARKLEAVLIAQTNATKVHRALDNVMDSSGPSDPAFQAGTDFVISLQLDPNNMDINIDGVVGTNTTSFKTNWGNATAGVLYRKRTEDDWTLGSYEEDPQTCLRRIVAFSTGKNFVITNTAGPSQTFSRPNPDGTIENRVVVYRTANYAADRFSVELQELPPAQGHDCNFNFRIVRINQITEVRMPLPPVPVGSYTYTSPNADPGGNAALPLALKAQLGNPVGGPFFGIVTDPTSPAVQNDPESAYLPLTNCS